MPPESFSSELGDVHERRSDRGTFSDEFRGASESLIENERPPQIMDAGRRGRRLLWVVILLGVALGVGGWAIWYWSEPIGEWFLGLGGGDDAGEASESGDSGEAEPTPPDAPAEPEKVFGVRGDPDGETPPTPEPGPMIHEVETPPTEPPATPPSTDPTPAPTPTPTPPASGTKVETLATKVRGKVSSGAVSSRLAKVDAALPDCWAKAGVSGPVELELRLSIKWNGRVYGVAVTGGNASLQSCVEKAVPGSGWPQPRDGGEAHVTRKWKLGGD